MDGSKGDLQNEYFNVARKERTLMAVFLTNGKKLVGAQPYANFKKVIDAQLAAGGDQPATS